ncbi:hypothetical protein FGIG_06915 [Fasciola gigantica]|uniref:Peptidase A2 domain-containing protein n=1 Tax=Fasciola gigantica TaxID=46835 RepID=A0A504WWF6_FASGI|nr:hypothetical protein FGIG_06915 [Fasciola gigantica]
MKHQPAASEQLNSSGEQEECKNTHLPNQANVEDNLGKQYSSRAPLLDLAIRADTLVGRVLGTRSSASSRTRIQEMKAEQLQLDMESLEIRQQQISLELEDLAGSVQPNDDESNSDEPPSLVLLPDIELTKFDGTPKRLWKFLSSFKADVANGLLNDRERLCYLIHCSVGEARKAIEDCVMLPLHKGYVRAIDIFESQFGYPDDVAESILDKMGNGTKIKPTDITSLRKLVKQVLRWAEIAVKKRREGTKLSFRHLVRYLEESLSTFSYCYGQGNSTLSQWKGDEHTRQSYGMRRRVKVIAGRLDEKCPVCCEDHGLESCGPMRVVQRVAVLNSTVHLPRSPNTPTKTNINSVKTEVPHTFMGFVPVRLLGPRGSKETYAFLDNGSDSTLLSSAAANSLGIDGPLTRLSVTTLAGTTSQLTSEVNFAVQSLSGDCQLQAERAYTLKTLPMQTAYIPSGLDCWSYLKDVYFEKNQEQDG